MHKPIDQSEISQKIHAFYASEEYNRLKALYERPNFLAAIKKPRSETVFSSLLVWLISNPEFNNAPIPPIKLLLFLLARKAMQQDAVNKSDKMNLNIRESIITNNFEVDLVDAKTEHKAEGKQRIDVCINCRFKFNNTNGLEEKITIYLENKIDQEESINQCKKYYDYYSANKPSDSDTQIFVFLSIDEENIISDSKHFIRITHQEILDYVLTPISLHNKQYSTTSNVYLSEFINAMTSLNTGGKSQIAKDPYVQQLLRKFYENNIEIIEMAIEAGSDSEAIITAVKKQQKIRRRYRISCVKWGLMPQIVFNNNLMQEILLATATGKNVSSIDDLKKYFPMLGAFYTTSSTKTGFNNPITICGKDYRISNQMLRPDKNKTLLDEFLAKARDLGFEIEDL